jgi:hypothetical protein
LKTAVQNRRENRDRMKIEEKNIVRQISAFKVSVIKRLDELERHAASTANYMMLVTKKVHNKVRMF